MASKRDELFSVNGNGLTPRPSASDISGNKVLRADGSWVAQSGGGGGGGNGVDVYTGTLAPDNSSGSNGDLYVQIVEQMRYLRMKIYKNRDNTNLVQFSDIRLVSAVGVNYNFSGATASCNASPASASEDVDKLLDNNISTKLCAIITPSDVAPLIINIDLGTTLNVADYPTFQYWTANDADGRDPVSFDVELSTDGVNYITVLEARNLNVTSTRYALGYASPPKFHRT